MHRVSLRVRPLAIETRATEGEVPPGSEEAKAIVERVRLALLAERKGTIPYSLSKKGKQG